MDILPIVIGSDYREPQGFRVFKSSLERRTTKPLHILPLTQSSLRFNGWYWRKQEFRDGAQWDAISGAPMATDFAITRFLTPFLLEGGWVLFAECDMLCLADIAELFDLRDDRYAVMCVKHDHKPHNRRKMDDQPQLPYVRKNWSSLVLWNIDHPANRKLTVEMVNALPGRDLHRFCWLADDEIGALPAEWNYLVGQRMPRVKPKLLHFTEGTPELVKNVPFAELWEREATLLRKPVPSEMPGMRRYIAA